MALYNHIMEYDIFWTNGYIIYLFTVECMVYMLVHQI